MEWQDQAYILKVAPLGERTVLVNLLCHQHGHVRGVVHPGRACPRSALLPGVVTTVQAKARLEEHLSTLTLEVAGSTLARLYTQPQRLAIVQSLAHMLVYILPQQHPYPRLWTELNTLLEEHVLGDAFLAHYFLFERTVLQELGFGLDLTVCALTGAVDDLVYVSPLTGRAACRTAGAPYHDRLLTLPAFFRGPTPQDLPHPAVDTLHAAERLCGHFIRMHFFQDKARVWATLRQPVQAAVVSSA